MAGAESWLIAEIGGTKRASLIQKPEVIGALFRRLKRPVFIVGSEGSESFESDVLIHLLSSLSHTCNVPVIATAHSVKVFESKGLHPSASMNAMEAVDLLRDPKWMGLDGHGPYDLAFVAGISYSYAWLLFSGIRLGAPDLMVISLDPRYHPHAGWSFPNLKPDAWRTQMESLENILVTCKKPGV